MTEPGATTAGAAPPIARLERPAPLAPMAPPSRSNKALRIVWSLVWATLYRIVPTPLFGVRCAILRLFGATIAPGARPYPGARIWAPWSLTMAPQACLANGVECYNVAPIMVGRGAVVSQRAHLCAASHDFRAPDFPLVGAPIQIEAGAWVAADAFVGPGVTVGERAVVGARAVLMRSVPAECVVAGNPATVVSRRTTTGQREPVA